MSALPPKADIGTQSRHVRFVPKADSCTAANNAKLRNRRLQRTAAPTTSYLFMRTRSIYENENGRCSSLSSDGLRTRGRMNRRSLLGSTLLTVAALLKWPRSIRGALADDKNWGQ